MVRGKATIVMRPQVLSPGKYDKRGRKTAGDGVGDLGLDGILTRGTGAVGSFHHHLPED